MTTLLDYPFPILWTRPWDSEIRSQKCPWKLKEMRQTREWGRGSQGWGLIRREVTDLKQELGWPQEYHLLLAASLFLQHSTLAKDSLPFQSKMQSLCLDSARRCFHRERKLLQITNRNLVDGALISTVFSMVYGNHTL